MSNYIDPPKKRAGRNALYGQPLLPPQPPKTVVVGGKKKTEDAHDWRTLFEQLGLLDFVAGGIVPGESAVRVRLETPLQAS